MESVYPVLYIKGANKAMMKLISSNGGSKGAAVYLIITLSYQQYQAEPGTYRYMLPPTLVKAIHESGLVFISSQQENQNHTAAVNCVRKSKLNVVEKEGTNLNQLEPILKYYHGLINT